MSVPAAQSQPMSPPGHPPELWLIAAVARDGAIGRDGSMPWHLPQDLAHFRRVTMGCPVLMGRKTWDSLPARFRPLPGRPNWVVTRDPRWQAPGAHAAPSLDAALAAARAWLQVDAPALPGPADGAASMQPPASGPAKVFLIGGGQLYAEALPRAEGLVLTEIELDVPDADTRFPAWRREDFVEIGREPGAPDAPLAHAFITLRRRAA